MTTMKPSVLIVLATGKMGSGIADAFLASKKYNVFGTSRDPAHPKLRDKGVTPVAFEFGNKESIKNALKVSNANVVVIITDLVRIAKSRQVEVEHAKIMMNACQEAENKPFVILCSSYSCEFAPEKAAHMRSKFDMETYLKNDSGIVNYTILQAASFYENWDDPSVMNPLVRGKLSDLYPPNCRVTLVATRDIGKAAVLVASNPKQWNGKTLNCISCFMTGNECAAILTEVSGVLCTYKQSPPPFILRLLLPYVYNMVQYASSGYNGINCEQDIQRFRSLIPDTMGPKEWFESKGQWSDGSKFNEPPPPRSSNNIAAYVMLSAPLVVLAIVIGLEMWK